MHKNDLFVHNSVVLCNLMTLNSDSLAHTRAYIKFFTLVTVATLQHFLKISMLRVTTR